MTGINFPENWKQVVKKTKVIELEKYSGVVDAYEVEVAISSQLIMSTGVFGSTEPCLALSGGLDSSILAVIMKNLNIKFTAITIGSNENHPDIIFAKKLAEQFQLKHIVSILSPPRRSVSTYDDLFNVINHFGFKFSVHADCIDEMQGGYWLHQRPQVEGHKEEEYTEDERRRLVFEDYWKKLIPNHLNSMQEYAKKYSVGAMLPYLSAHNFFRRIPINQRATNTARKIVLKNLAKRLQIPDDLIDRKKLGLCNIWDTFA